MEAHDYHRNTYIATDIDGKEYWVDTRDNEWFFGCALKESVDAVFYKHPDYSLAMQIRHNGNTIFIGSSDGDKWEEIPVEKCIGIPTMYEYIKKAAEQNEITFLPST